MDSANTNTTYGAVLESHEITGDAYNNISSVISTLGTMGKGNHPVEGPQRRNVPGNLPDRPRD